MTMTFVLTKVLNSFEMSWALKLTLDKHLSVAYLRIVGNLLQLSIRVQCFENNELNIFFSFFLNCYRKWSISPFQNKPAPLKPILKNNSSFSYKPPGGLLKFHFTFISVDRR